MHLGESREEVQFLHDGSGPWRALIEMLGAWTDTWQPPDAVLSTTSPGWGW